MELKKANLRELAVQYAADLKQAIANIGWFVEDNRKLSDVVYTAVSKPGAWQFPQLPNMQ